ncbi:MarR family winged helix-turn-helix transcriptional regulator [Streptomyces sp. NPDC055775]
MTAEELQQGSIRSVVVVLGDLVTYPGTTVSEIAARTGLPQSQDSTAVPRLEHAGSADTEPDPADRRRRLIRPTVKPSARVAEVRAATIDDAVAAALSGPDGTAPDPVVLHEVAEALDLLAHRDAVGRRPRPRSRCRGRTSRQSDAAAALRLCTRACTIAYSIQTG